MFLYSRWMDLSLPTRIEIASRFGIIKRGSTEVFDNKIKSDGYDLKEVEAALNIDALKQYLDTDEIDIGILFTGLVDKVEGRDVSYLVKGVPLPSPEEVEKITIEEQLKAGIPALEVTGAKDISAEIITPKKAGRPKKTT